MKTLIIHPQDRSTFFLDIVYKHVPEKTIVTGGVTRVELINLILAHDRIMMLGHGTPDGLLNMGQFPDPSMFIIDRWMAPLLAEKDQNVFIWCNADQFVNRHRLKGFYSGMFISEVGEATYCGLPGTSQELVDESNYGFCGILGSVINEPKEAIFESVKEKYGLIAETNPVALYNHQRLFKA
jgi:hypothetical protein